MNHEQKVKDFLNQKVIAVTGVSRNPKGKLGNHIYKKFLSAGYKVYPVNSSGGEIDGGKFYCDLKSIPEKVDAVFVGVNPKNSFEVVRECAELGIEKVWFHNLFGSSNYSEEALNLCKEKNISAITAGCPMMYLNADFGHKCFKFFMKITGKFS